MVLDHIEAFHRPLSVAEAVRLLGDTAGGRYVAGGTDVIVQADRSVRFLVDVTKLGLSYIRQDGARWAIGATTTMRDLEDSPAIRGLANGILARSAHTCGSVQIRNRATVGGNLANASPAADTATPLLAFDASAVLADAQGQRSIPLTELFQGPGESSLHGALLLEVVFTAPGDQPASGWSFQKYGRTQTDISVVNAAAGLALDSAGRIAWARIALGAVAPTPVRAFAAEQMLVGRKFEAAIVDEVAAQVEGSVQPISDVRASADYRRHISGVLVRRALRDCAAQVGCAL